MPDQRFFIDLGPVSLSELTTLTGAQAPADGARTVAGVATLGLARPDTVTFLADRRRVGELAASQAGACFVAAAQADAVPVNCVALVVASPQAAYALSAARLHQTRQFTRQAVAGDAVIEDDVLIASGVTIGPGARIGRGTQIGPGSVIGPGVCVGRDCRIGPNVTLGFCLLGDRVQVLAGAVVGEAGFGATAGPKGLIDIPQLGRVIIQDGVTIGANSTIDRGAFEDTVIGENTKIDNLVQIAHNVRVGRNCVMAAQTGISGSVTIGDGTQFGGRAGVADHVTIGAGARVGAASGVMKNIPAGETWGGMPARPIRRFMRETAWLSKMADRRDADRKRGESDE